jgi:hypothetical protein
MANLKLTKDYTKLTLPQKKAIKIIMENFATPNPKTPAQLQQAVGTDVVIPDLLKNAHAQNEFKPVVKTLEELRNQAMDALRAMPLTTVEYSDLINGIDKLTKNIQLLSGEDTDRTQHTFSWAPMPNQPKIIEHGEHRNPLLAEKLGDEAPQFETEVESVRIASSSGENRSHLESLTERRAFDPE